ncbi:repeat protein [Moumouvirus goulette]|uniref:Repeat protein n=1 Tax=Moumouvirus goulette TaxID=1247379 RepID=M1NLQ7_9VIRU|nr:repeat protein [Moumouvirus goulette]AGF84915.1 repeat protein [Moumouvirus goulette]
MLKYLITEYKKQIDLFNIIKLSIENDKINILKYLISIQPNNHTDININDAILLSLQKGYLDIYHYLKYKNTNPDACLEEAVFYGHCEIVKELLISGRDPIKALNKAAENGNFDMTSLILDCRGLSIEENDINLAITLVKQRIISQVNKGDNNNVEEELNIIELLESFKCLSSVRKNEENNSEYDDDDLLYDEDPELESEDN